MAAINPTTTRANPARKPVKVDQSMIKIKTISNQLSCITGCASAGAL
jgi:hypothetical protein